MSRVYAKCPQCEGRECADISCKFSGIKHKNAAPQASPSVAPADSGAVPAAGPAVAAPYDAIGYEAAWTGAPASL